jgi:hypothetical protein
MKPITPAFGFTVEVVTATPEQSHDFSEFHDVELGDDGRLASTSFTWV